MKIEIIEENIGEHKEEKWDTGTEVAGCWVCLGPGVETNEFYPEMRYCGPQHREMHQPEDHDEPWPFSVRQKEGVGRLLVAARDIEKGELIFTEQALACGPNHTLQADHCLDCMKPIEDKNRCSACGWPVCNTECESGPNHGIECSLLAENRSKIDVEELKEEGVLYWPISALRLLILAKSRPGDWSILQRMLGHR
ncbi:uncharacterized protein LOC111708000 [Eurytemora carolleeae]|uniref:uncharacterized protein LOC111708000 n=1 Tax=Eurytemora carolleeae TaxID=1294199 RepID=UPI000C77E316|nr:uncharacterized protein LOC111708000 [Eurytemora carolleeae]|eukprot:XP_023336984.1 uncharacterized protein LOC111708000 [Eurytemora affinis]